MAGAQRPRGRAVPPAPSSRARLAPPPAPPGRVVLGPLPGTSSAGAGLPRLTRPQAARRESEAPITGAALCWGSGPGSSRPPPPNLREGLGSPGGEGGGVAGTGAAQGPRVPHPQLQSSPGRLPALSPGSQAEGPLRPTLPRTFLASVRSQRPWRPWTTGHPSDSRQSLPGQRRRPGAEGRHGGGSQGPPQTPLWSALSPTRLPSSSPAGDRPDGPASGINSPHPQPSRPPCPPTSCLIFLN